MKSIGTKKWIGHDYNNDIEGSLSKWGREKDYFYYCLSF